MWLYKVSSDRPASFEKQGTAIRMVQIYWQILISITATKSPFMPLFFCTHTIFCVRILLENELKEVKSVFHRVRTLNAISSKS